MNEEPDANLPYTPEKDPKESGSTSKKVQTLLDRLNLSFLPFLALSSFAVCAYVLLRQDTALTKREEIAAWGFAAASGLSSLAYAVRAQGTDNNDTTRETTSTKLSSWLLVACLVADGYVLLGPASLGQTPNPNSLTSQQTSALTIFTSFGAAFAAYYFWVSFRRVKTEENSPPDHREETTKWLALATLSLFAAVTGIAFIGAIALVTGEARTVSLDIFKTAATVAGTLITTVIGFYFGSDQAKKSGDRDQKVVQEVTKAIQASQDSGQR